MNIGRLLAATFLAMVPALAFAAEAGPSIPEPETMALLGIGAVALVIARWRRKK